ncbi:MULTISPECIES: type III pantothenate kinase [Caproicibacterium]|jgi:type III pantothenate kinase|uniref:Type III pantothenate kinase n=1 Tax=Caproicibacterium lactatifermentans TaxID=2666138 RepID=A0A859DSG5_9FIRM|nr:type III pantothenate kinase [Caproicibacterium lactatifermentans]ARP51241.1 pantothenate kinase [Ruminococcaceae bacterium CPB6]MDD4807709.1 type III pantothenate kinase [Oscillospiraceae bacterium]QKN24395.1 type III pantothenate kinase [Caproicibacterium lactatifermentans]QKO30590.1 type III pantothenate kinase [Caproicibacterium lactatifermentans]
MIIAIDVGNTNIVLGCLDSKRTYFTARLSTDVKKTSDEYALMIRSLFSLHGVDRHAIEGAIISSVVPPLSLPLQQAICLVTGKTALIVSSGLKTGLNILMENPAALGADLVVDAVAASAKYPKPIFVFDMGTATTLSVIDKKGNYIGGMIIPGPVISMNALANHASQLSHVDLEAPSKLIGNNTKDCMRSGAVYGHAAMVDGLIDRAEEEIGTKATVVATGGVAPIIIAECKHKIILDDTLMLQGLLLLYQKNSRKPEPRRGAAEKRVPQKKG